MQAEKPIDLAEARAEHIATVADRMARRMGGRFVRDPKRWADFVAATAATLSTDASQ